MKIAVLCPHFDPDTAPTGVVMSRIVGELVALGHHVDVYTSLPWYRQHSIDVGWTGKWVRVEATAWGSITRVDPFPGDDKTNLVRRAVGFLGFTALIGWRAIRGGRVDAVIAMSPPLTMGLTGWLVHLVRRGPLIFNIQDVFPDAAVQTGAISNRSIIAVASWLERLSYRRSAAVTVLSEDLRRNVTAKIGPTRQHRVHVIPNFVDVDRIVPADRMTSWRHELGIGDEIVVLYAGNVGFSQSLDMVIDAARRLPEIHFVINGDGSAKAHVQSLAAALPNVHLTGYQPIERLVEVLATGDIHLVPLRAGLGAVSVPSKTYSILAAGRPVLASIDPGTEVPRLLDESGAGLSVPPDNVEAFVAGLRYMVEHPEETRQMGAAGRRWVQQAMSPAMVASEYVALIESLQ